MNDKFIKYKMSLLGRCLVLHEFNDFIQYLKSYNQNLGIQLSINPASYSIIKCDTQCSYDSQIPFLFLHGKYIYNFSRTEITNQIDILVNEINIAHQLNCGVIIHQGKNVASEHLTKLQAINNYVNHITDAINQTFNYETVIILENSCGAGTELGFTIEELAFIYHQFDENDKHRIGFCIDTCHIFSAGVVDMRKQNIVAEFLDNFDKLIGLNKLKCIHFNDSQVPFGAKRDIHGDIFGGYITNHLLGGSQEGMKYLAIRAQELQIPLIFETPCLLFKQIPEQPSFQYHIVRKWINQEIISDNDNQIINSIMNLSHRM